LQILRQLFAQFCKQRKYVRARILKMENELLFAVEKFIDGGVQNLYLDRIIGARKIKK
jgi:hypothetical protein